MCQSAQERSTVNNRCEDQVTILYYCFCSIESHCLVIHMHQPSAVDLFSTICPTSLCPEGLGYVLAPSR